MEHRALGKGLSALIPDNLKLSDEKEAKENIAYVPIEKIKESSFQPRINYDDQKLKDLVASIKEKGVLQPLVVRKQDDGYEIVAGERRLKAARILNLQKVPVMIKQVSSEEALVLALVENIQREDLNPIEEAKAFQQLIEEFTLTQEDVAQSVGKDRSTISNALRLLKLPEDIQQAVFSGEISTGHARALLSIENAQKQRQYFEQTKKKGFSVRELETKIKAGEKSPFRQKKAKSQELVVLENALQERLGTKVRIQAQKKRGKIVIEYYSLKDLERILDILKR